MKLRRHKVILLEQFRRYGGTISFPFVLFIFQIALVFFLILNLFSFFLGEGGFESQFS